MSLSEISTIINQNHFKSFNKIYDAVKKQNPNVSKKEVRQAIMTRKKDVHLKRLQTKPFQIKIFSPTLNCWFMDLLDNGDGHVPRWYHIFIGVNNRYAVANGMNSKSGKDVRESLMNFCERYHPVKLTSDQESAFLDKQTLELLSAYNVLLQTVPDKNHSTLGIIDRFIRTLRDMNTPTDEDARQSNDTKFKFFEPMVMEELISIYNNTYHNSIGMSPNEMFQNPDLEKEYIFKCIDKNEKQRNIKDFDLNVGDYVRYVIGRDPMKKKRYRVTHESFKIAGKDGKSYILEARDGSTIIKPRYLLIKADPNKYQQINTIEGSNKGVLQEILSYDKNTNKYKVRFEGQSRPQTIPASYLRGRFPQKLTPLEKEFFSKNSSSN